MVANQSQLWNFSFVTHLHKNIDLVRNNFTGQMMVRRVSPAVDFPVLAALCNIKQRNLMEIYDVLSENGVCVSLCEFINGTMLPNRLYDVKTAKQILCQICDGLTALHSHGIVHRDIKPENIMLLSNGTVKIIDYSISRLMKPDQRKDTTAFGTAGYAPPEQFGFAQTNGKADIYSCGVLLNYMLTGKLPSEELHQGVLKSVMVNSNRENTNVILGSKNRVLYGSDHITDTLCGKRFRLSPLSFYQVNRAQAEKLYTLAREYADLKGDEVVLDLYCGTGTIGLTMADSCKRLIGVEIVGDAVKDARLNAELNGVNNASFICGDAAYAAEQLEADGTRPDVVIIDPPRKGCDRSLIDAVVGMSPSRVVYVSCDPETLARDLRTFSEKNYSVKEITPVDMFPRTSHVETVVLLSRICGQSAEKGLK